MEDLTGTVELPADDWKGCGMCSSLDIPIASLRVNTKKHIEIWMKCEGLRTHSEATSKLTPRQLLRSKYARHDESSRRRTCMMVSTRRTNDMTSKGTRLPK